jgi:hypothetical protein
MTSSSSIKALRFIRPKHVNSRAKKYHWKIRRPTVLIMDTPPAASTCSTRAESDSSVDSSCTSNLGKRPRVDAKARDECSSLITSKLPCHEDIRQKAAMSPHLKKPFDECAQRRPLALESESQDADDANTHRALRSMLAPELEPRYAPRVGDRHRFGGSIIFMVLRAYQIETSSNAFGLATNLLHRALALPKFRDQAALDPALPLACCSLGIKWECAAPARCEDLCRLVEKMGIVLPDQALVKMELSLVEALNWSIDAVTPSHLLANIQLLSHPPIPNLETSVEFMLRVYYTYSAAHAVHLPSTVVRAIFAAVAGISPPAPAAVAEPSDHADYRRILALLLRYTKGQCTSASLGMPADAEQALRHEWLAWIPEGLAPLGRAQPL